MSANRFRDPVPHAVERKKSDNPAILFENSYLRVTPPSADRQRKVRRIEGAGVDGVCRAQLFPPPDAIGVELLGSYERGFHLITKYQCGGFGKDS